GPRRVLAVERRLQAANGAEVGAEGERLEPNAELGDGGPRGKRAARVRKVDVLRGRRHLAGVCPHRGNDVVVSPLGRPRPAQLELRAAAGADGARVEVEREQLERDEEARVREVAV